MFAEEFHTEHIGVRTKKIIGMVMDEISTLAPELSEADAEEKAKKALENAGLKIKSADKGTDALFFMSTAQAKALAELAIAGEGEKKLYKEALEKNPSYDMALFGRMVASDPSLNYDAAAQVAHSISTHGVHNEFDYFTAVDDRQADDNAGAAHVGSMEFNSATLYRYATVNVNELEQSLGTDTPDVVKGFAEAFICSMPTGKQNSYANRTLPGMVYVTIRTDQPVNLVGAFERPVAASEEGYEKASKNRLIAYAKEVYDNYGAPPEQAFAFGAEMDGLAEKTPLPQLLEQLRECVAKQLSERGVD
jgi:CRISPR system Cascade subunit CasC